MKPAFKSRTRVVVWSAVALFAVLVAVELNFDVIDRFGGDKRQEALDFVNDSQLYNTLRGDPRFQYVDAFATTDPRGRISIGGYVETQHIEALKAVVSALEPPVQVEFAIVETPNGEMAAWPPSETEERWANWGPGIDRSG